MLNFKSKTLDFLHHNNITFYLLLNLHLTMILAHLRNCANVKTSFHGSKN
jgi:hypothetical protein